MISDKTSSVLSLWEVAIDTGQMAMAAKSEILLAVNQGRLDEAKEKIDVYTASHGKDADIFAIEGLIASLEGQNHAAENLLKSGYRLESENINLLLNLASHFEKKGAFNTALSFFNAALEPARDDIRRRIQSKIDQFRRSHAGCLKPGRPKIIFFVKKALDGFLDDIIFNFAEDYEIRKCIITDKEQVDAGMAWADICWFEWCNEWAVYGSNHPLAPQKVVLCRIHRYEVFTPYPERVAWENVDRLIVVADHLAVLLEAKVPEIHNLVSIQTIENGVDTDRYRFSKRKKGFRLAWVCYMNSRKNPALVLQILHRLVAIDDRYRLHVAGKFMEHLSKLYWEYQVEKMGLSSHVIFEGWQSDMDGWLDDKDYLLSASLHESFGYTIAEAMAKGIKPVIHDFPFAAEIWDERWLFSTIDDAVAMITAPDYNAEEYCDYIGRRYSLSRQLDAVRGLFDSFGKAST